MDRFNREIEMARGKRMRRKEKENKDGEREREIIKRVKDKDRKLEK